MIQSPMIASPRTAAALSLQPMMVRRRRALRVAPPAGQVAVWPIDGVVETEGETRNWKDDLSFFLACYAAGMLFFLVMLS